MILLATRKRPQNIINLMQQCEALHTKHMMLLLVDNDDDSYDHLKLPSFAHILKCPPANGGGKLYQTAWRLFPNEPFYGIMADDTWPLTQYWDSILGQAAIENTAACPLEGPATMHQRAHITYNHVFISNRFVYAMGGLNYLEFIHGAIDAFWEKTIKEVIGNFYICQNVTIEHRHPKFAKYNIPFDETYKHKILFNRIKKDPKTLKTLAPDAYRWEQAYNSDFWVSLIEAVKIRLKNKNYPLPPTDELFAKTPVSSLYYEALDEVVSYTKNGLNVQTKTKTN